MKNISHISFYLLLCFSICFYLFACTTKSSQDSKDYSNSLILLPGAHDQYYYKLYGSDQLAYQLRARYPASDVVKQISELLEKAGWRPLEEDFLNPGLRSSHVVGWQRFDDATKKPMETVQQWLADWENSKGDIVRYTLQYRYEHDKDPNLDDLIVRGIYIPEEVVKASQEQLLELNPQAEMSTK